MANFPPRAFVIGWPISHSLSPHLHQFWLKKYAIRGSYEKIAIPPDGLDQFLEQIKRNNFIGGNVTLPHKRSVFNKLNQFKSVLDATAVKLQAANTLWHENGSIKAGNTDAHGFSANMDDFAPQWRKAKTATVLGAGGASAAVVLALLNAGIGKVTIVNRTLSKAKALAEIMGAQCNSANIDSLGDILKDTDLLVNTTSLGMKGQPPLEIDISNLAKSAIVADIVYNPVDTQLIKHARLANITTVDGIGMLLHQAVPGFEKWFGPRPDVSPELRNHMLNILNQDGS